MAAILGFQTLIRRSIGGANYGKGTEDLQVREEQPGHAAT